MPTAHLFMLVLPKKEIVLGMLVHRNLLHHLPEGGTVKCPIFSHDPYLLRALSHLPWNYCRTQRADFPSLTMLSCVKSREVILLMPLRCLLSRKLSSTHGNDIWAKGDSRDKGWSNIFGKNIFCRICHRSFSNGKHWALQGSLRVEPLGRQIPKPQFIESYES